MSAMPLHHDNCFWNKSPELLADLASQCAAVLRERLGIDSGKAEETGRDIAERMSFIWGGQSIYIPKGLIYKLSIRDRQIFAEFTGKNHAYLAHKYGVSLQMIYRIVKAIHAEEVSKRQLSFGLEV